MLILHNKSVGILGLGSHGGGITSTQFAHYNNASRIFISDKNSAKHLSKSIKVLSPLLNLDYVTIETDTHNINTLCRMDVIIKNPAIPRTNKLMSALIRNNKKIETDISLFLKTLHSTHNNTRCYAITGTKGKSSISTALHKWNTMTDTPSALAGNITYSPLHFLMQDNFNTNFQHSYVLELSSFQIGDLALVDEVPYDVLHMGILTNIMLDHQNYYKSMQEYVADKLLLFNNLPSHAKAILPFKKTPHNKYDDKIKTCASECKASVVWHSNTELPKNLIGAWCTDDGLFIRKKAQGNTIKICDNSCLPSIIIKENISIFSAACMSIHKNLPTTTQQWKEIFTIKHRKEYIGSYTDRSFYNDTAATIPQAMHLHHFQNNTNTNLHVICGGTDKNLLAQDFITACQHIPKNRLTLYLLEVSYTQ